MVHGCWLKRLALRVHHVMMQPGMQRQCTCRSSKFNLPPRCVSEVTISTRVPGCDLSWMGMKQRQTSHVPYCVWIQEVDASCSARLPASLRAYQRCVAHG